MGAGNVVAVRAAGAVAAAAALSAVQLALLVVLLMLAVYLLTPHRCFLDVLNADIERSCTFRPFYAASDRRWGLPLPEQVVPGLERLDANFEVIQGEMEGALRAAGAGARALPRMHDVYNRIFAFGSGELPAAKWAAAQAARLVYGKDTDVFDRIGSPDWRVFNLLLFGRPVPGNAERCPETLRLLRSIPGVQSALFSVLAPGAFIPPHSDPAKGVIRYHLALRVPALVDGEQRCFIEVDCKGGPGCARADALHRYRWAEGESVLFDDVFPHWVVNDTDEVRVILFVDILRPDLMASAFSRASVLQKLANAVNYYHPGVRRLIRESRAI